MTLEDPAVTPAPAAARSTRRTVVVVVTLIVLAVLIVLVAQIFTGCWVSWPSSMEYDAAIGYVEPPRLAAPEEAAAFAGPGHTPLGSSLNPVTPGAESIALGGARYASFCLPCHGEPQGPPGGVGKFFQPPPPGLATVTPARDDAYIFQVITNGVGRMPPLASRMVPTDRWSIVNYLRDVAPAADGQPGATPTDPLARAAQVYAANCAQCHGAAAEGGFAPGLRPSAFILHATDEQVRDVVRHGRRARGMPSFGAVLSDQQVQEMATLLKRLQAQGGERLLQEAPPSDVTTTTARATTTTSAPAQTTTTAPAGTTTTAPAADLAAAQAVYDAKCQGCHGADGAGGGVGPQLKPNQFVQNSSPADVRSVIENGRPGTAMPPWQGSLRPEEIDALVSLLESWQAAGATDVGQASEPREIPFAHDRHVQKGLGCLFCHSSVLQGPAADLPPLQLCASCHRSISTQNERTQQVVAAYEEGATVSWARVYDLPDFVYFTHLSHVVTGKVECGACHGDVGQMQLAEKAQNLSMGFCLSCHGDHPQYYMADCGTCHM